MDEIWHNLVYQGERYEQFVISNIGRLKNIKTGTIYKQSINPDTGYKQVCVSLGSRSNKKLFKIHRCVAESFIDNSENKPFINHKDGNKINNKVDNLEWTTPKENTEHAIRTGLMEIKRGSSNQLAKLTDEQVKYIRENYIPRDKEFGCNALCKRFNIGRTTFSEVVHYKTYTNVV